jgi:hypothetical protein
VLDVDLICLVVCGSVLQVLLKHLLHPFILYYGFLDLWTELLDELHEPFGADRLGPDTLLGLLWSVCCLDVWELEALILSEFPLIAEGPGCASAGTGGREGPEFWGLREVRTLKRWRVCRGILLLLLMGLKLDGWGRPSLAVSVGFMGTSMKGGKSLGLEGWVGIGRLIVVVKLYSCLIIYTYSVSSLYCPVHPPLSL